MTKAAQNRAERTNRLIVDAARRVFSERGYEGTSTDALAAEVPVSKRTLYNYFASKELLFQAVVASSWSWFISSAAKDIEHAQPRDFEEAERFLTHYGHSVLEHWRRPGVVELIRLVIGEAHRFPELSEAFLLHGKEPAVRGLIAFFDYLHRDGLADIPDARLSAWQFHGMLKETVFLPAALGLKPLFEDKAIVDTAVRTALRPVMASVATAKRKAIA